MRTPNQRNGALRRPAEDRNLPGCTPEVAVAAMSGPRRAPAPRHCNFSLVTSTAFPVSVPQRRVDTRSIRLSSFDRNLASSGDALSDR